MRTLNGRLGILLENLPEHSDTLADIGTDHGKLIVSAVITGRCDKGIGVDISENSLSKAKELAKVRSVDDKIEFLVGNGFLPLKNKVTTAVIAGMGGNEIVSILSQGDYAQNYVLLPHQDAHILRSYLRKENYNVIKDFVIFDKKYYSLIVAQKGENTYTDDEIYLGKNFPETKYFNEKNFARKNYIETLLKRKSEFSEKPLSNEILEEYKVLNKWYDSNK